MEIQFVDITSYRGISSDAEHFYARVGAPKDVQEFYITCMDCDVNAGVYFHDERQLRYFPTEEEARSLWQKDHGFDKREITLKYKEDDIADLVETGTIRFPSIEAIIKKAKEEFPDAVICFSISGSRKEFVKWFIRTAEGDQAKEKEILKTLNVI
jgi:hypothetical protein